MDRLDKFLFLFGIALMFTFFYPSYLCLMCIYGTILIIGGIMTKSFMPVTIGVISFVPYLMPQFKLMSLIFGIMTSLAALGAKGETHARTGESEKLYIERVVFGEMVLFELYTQNEKKYCIVEKITTKELYTIEDFNIYHESLCKALDKVHNIMEEDKSVICIWK